MLENFPPVELGRQRLQNLPLRRFHPLRRDLILPPPTVREDAMPILPMPSATADHEHEEARWNPERETLEPSHSRRGPDARPRPPRHQGVGQGVDHQPADLWQARLAVKTLRRDQREAIAEVGDE